MSDVNPRRSEIERRMDEFDLARRALKWILEHRVYWDRRFACTRRVRAPVTYGAARPASAAPSNASRQALPKS
jgi:hypothetical protein